MGSPLRQKIKIIVIVLFAITVVSYAIYRSLNLLEGPQIEIIVPRNGDTVTQALVIVSGKVKNIARLTLNDNHIYTDEKGNFEEKLLVPLGQSIITVKGEDKFGKSKSVAIELYRVAASSTQYKETVATTSATSTSITR